MNLLICGSGKGSWEMRGIQLGAALGARVTSYPTPDDAAWADVVVLVKKRAVELAPLIHRAKKPIVWDALDFWSQPAHNTYKADAAKFALQSQIAVIKPALVIGATQAMTAAARAFCPAEYLPHHSWAGLVPTPPREQVEVVAYEGNALYLGRWHGWLTEACAKRGWRFVVNPPNLADADIIVAFRDGPWDGWICREWKSGVKVVNAIAAGRPFISHDSAAVRELQPVGSVIESVDQLESKLDFWGLRSSRETAAAMSTDDAPTLTLDAVASRYRDILSKVGASCAT